VLLKDAERDLYVAKKLVDEKIFDKSIYHFQQSIGKAIKAILIVIGVYKKTHFVGRVLRNCVLEGKYPKNWYNDLLKAAEYSDKIEPDVSLSRYPGIIDDRLWIPFEEYDGSDAQNAAEKTDFVISIAEKFIKDWFSKS
jgi:HEPN domain-containing protein